MELYRPRKVCWDGAAGSLCVNASEVYHVARGSGSLFHGAVGLVVTATADEIEIKPLGTFAYHDSLCAVLRDGEWWLTEFNSAKFHGTGLQASRFRARIDATIVQVEHGDGTD